MSNADIARASGTLAAEARARGETVPEGVPDCAEWQADFRGTTLEFEEATEQNHKEGRLRFTLRGIRSHWSWIDFHLVVKDEDDDIIQSLREMASRGEIDLKEE